MDRAIKRIVKGGWYSSIIYNKIDTISATTQLGGCIAICSGQAKRRMIERGVDEKQLGRWVWIWFQGKSNHTIWFISAYQCRNNTGLTTIFSQ